MYESYHDEEAKKQVTGHPGYVDRFEASGPVSNRWGREDRDLEGCVVCEVEDVERVFSWVPAFASFVANQKDHGMRITQVRYIGHPDCIYAKMVRYMAGTSTQKDDKSIDYKIESKVRPLFKIQNT